MLDFDEYQIGAIESPIKERIWLVNIGGYRYSTLNATYGGDDYEAAIKPSSFNGITIERDYSETGLLKPSDFSCVISKDINPAIFQISEGVYQPLYVTLIINNVQIIRWRFKIVSIVKTYKEISIECQDILSQYMTGSYPKTALFSELTHTDRDSNDSFCVPVIFGTAYIPARTVYHKSDRYYVLAEGSDSVNVEELLSPREWPGNQPYTSGSLGSGATFNTSVEEINGQTYTCFQPMIRPLGGYDEFSVGIWISGDNILEPLVKYSKSSTRLITNPAEVIKFILEDMGVPGELLDNNSFTAAWNYYNDTIGMEFQGGFYVKTDKESILTQLLIACHAKLVLTEKIELHPNIYKPHVKTFTRSDIVLKSGSGYAGQMGTFRKTPSFDPQDMQNAGYAGVVPEGKPQDKLYKVVVTANGESQKEISSETIDFPFVKYPAHARRAAEFYFFRKFLKMGDITFSGKPYLNLQPGDVIRIDDDLYGDTVDVLIDSMTIKEDLTVTYKCSYYSSDFQNWSDSSADDFEIVEDTTDAFDGSGSSSGYVDGDTPAQITGLTATPNVNGAVFDWEKNYADDLLCYYYDIGVSSSSSPPTRYQYRDKYTSLPHASHFLSDAEREAGYKFVHIEVWAMNKSFVSSPKTHTYAQAVEVQVTTEIEDFPLLATQTFSNIPVLEGDVWTYNSSSGEIEWNLHKLWMNGKSYAIAAGSTEWKYIFWKNGDSGYFRSIKHPGNYDGDYVDDDGALIVLNYGNGAYSKVVTAMANAIIGSANIANLSVETGHIKNLAVTSAHIDKGQINNAHINDLHADKIIAGSLQLSHLSGIGDLNISSSGSINISAEDGLNVHGNGNVNIYDGGQIKMSRGDKSFIFNAYLNNYEAVLSIYPSTIYSRFEVGTSEYNYQYILLYSNSIVMEGALSVSKSINIQGESNLSSTSLVVKANNGGRGIIISTNAQEGETFDHLYCTDSSGLLFRLYHNGSAYASGRWEDDYQDYAEYIAEWYDGNPKNEDRRGFTVVFEDGKVRPAKPEDDPYSILAISSTPSVLGGCHSNGWKDKFLKDEFGEHLTEPTKHLIWTHDKGVDSENGLKRVRIDDILEDETGKYCIEDGNRISVPDDAEEKNYDCKIINPDYDSTQKYISRNDRPEWSPIGLIGIIRIRNDQPINPNWQKFKTINDNITEYLVK